MSDDYPIVIFRTRSDGLSAADVPDLPGCGAHGKTSEEAPRGVRLVIGMWLEVADEIGKPIPAPSDDAAIRLGR